MKVPQEMETRRMFLMNPESETYLQPCETTKKKFLAVNCLKKKLRLRYLTEL